MPFKGEVVREGAPNWVGVGRTRLCSGRLGLHTLHSINVLLYVDKCCVGIDIISNNNAAYITEIVCAGRARRLDVVQGVVGAHGLELVWTDHVPMACVCLS